MVTIEEFLDRKNPSLDSSNTLPGPNTVSINYSIISAVEDWEEFNYQTLRNLYGDVLDYTLQSPPDQQNPTKLEAEIWDENQFSLLFSQYMLSPIRYALRQAYECCEKSWEHNPQGEFLSYINFCPGDTKLAIKWKHKWHRTDFKSWRIPPEQIQTCSGDHWNVRYGWIITEDGLTVFLTTRDSVGPGLSASRNPRTSAATPGHARVASDDTDLSSMIAPLSITTQSYRDEPPNVEYQPIKAKFVSWQEGSEGLNVKKALFMLFMLAGAPGGPKFVQTSYPPLDSWSLEGKVFRHNSTGRVCERLQPNSLLYDISGQIADPPALVEETGRHSAREGEPVAGLGKDDTRGKRRKLEPQ
ncbi:hypothetical protein AYO20_09970 [Fonsecaea nubica]|uniref:Uncharacterized protein n=1 Tax=Fonsecaea nubica TaxID=856822 RepID=A0A178C9I6_9EURO|nr:hypothetical protein AYO20_09970 [Fonsecaea nubica]OAL26629.1 hypothetical protein AYO20_09970 [Fonsecaea nubica]